MADDIQQWRNDIVGWSEANVYVRSPLTGKVGPLVLLDHQKEWLQEATKKDAEGGPVYRVVVASWPKREGKSLSASLILAHRLACFEGQQIGIIANSERQAQSNVFDELVGIYQNSPGLAEYTTTKSFQAHKLTITALNNTAQCFPASWRTIQGMNFTALACDELHASEDHGRAWTFASQQTEAVGSQAVISSQAGAPINVNPLWRLFNAKEPHIFFDYRQDVATPWGIKLAAQARGELLPGEWDYLWGNAWGATGLKLLSAADIETACQDYAMPRTRQEWEELRREWKWGGCIISVGLDRAGVSRTGDRTCFTVCARLGSLYRILVSAILDTGSEAEILEVDKQTREVFGNPRRLYFESYGCSDVVEKCRGATLESPTTGRQNQIYSHLARLFIEERIWFPAECDLLKQELIAFEYDAERAGQTRFGTQSGHDDTIYAASFAVDACGIDRGTAGRGLKYSDLFFGGSRGIGLAYPYSSGEGKYGYDSAGRWRRMG